MLVTTLRCDSFLFTFLDEAAQRKSSTEQASYKVPEYYSYNIDTFADLEIEMAQHRQSQPDPRVPYYHHYPWEKKAS